MSHGFKIVQWTPFKKKYDLVLVVGVIVFVGAYVTAGMAQPDNKQALPIQLVLRAFGACALALLTLILAIGPLARLSPRFLPFLYNRRHLGVTCFFLALAHATLVVVWYHGFSDTNPFISLLAANPRYDSIQGFPFESLGVIALLILLVMAATSHDFWNGILGPNLWKALHMLVYWAYALVVAHVMLGAAQGERGVLHAVVVGAGALFVAALHIFAGSRETAHGAGARPLETNGWLRVCPPGEIPDGRARIVTPPRGERIAVFREGAKIYAISNVCRHQGGPLGEGRIVDGCVTCPWHGFQYRPQDGRAPEPFTEKISTYRTRIEGGAVFVFPEPVASGEETPPSVVEGILT
jgi:DMSO/TMAO reductase YedYZ heme-binding membrane subunit/nitrite reductase/ring-hydroxylating ferredoxin subunit